MELEEGRRAVDGERQEWQQQNKIINAVTENWNNDSIDTYSRYNLVNKSFLWASVYVCVCMRMCVCVNVLMQLGRQCAGCDCTIPHPGCNQGGTQRSQTNPRRHVPGAAKHPPQGKSCHRGQGENPTSGRVGPRRQASRPRPQHPTASPEPPKTLPHRGRGTHQRDTSTEQSIL